MNTSDPIIASAIDDTQQIELPELSVASGPPGDSETNNTVWQRLFR